MITLGDVISIVSVLIALVATIVAVKGSKRTDFNDLEARVTERTELNVKLDNIAQDVADVKEEIKLQRREVQNLVERMAKVEASAKQAHHRLDMMSERRRVEHED